MVLTKHLERYKRFDGTVSRPRSWFVCTISRIRIPLVQSLPGSSLQSLIGDLEKFEQVFRLMLEWHC